MKPAMRVDAADEFPLILRVFRFDPARGGEPSYACYDLRIRRGLSISNLLEHVQQFVDPSLSFNASCRRGVCTSCLVRINGVPKLACLVEVRPDDGEITIDPVDRNKVLRDTVMRLSPGGGGVA